jgi:hypothetical protein
MAGMRRKNQKREPSLHEQRMRRWTIALVVTGALVFAGLFYLLSQVTASP